MSGDFTEKVLDELKTRRLRREAQACARERELREACPELRSLDAQIAGSSLRDRASLPRLLAQRAEIVSSLLAQRGLPKDWLASGCECAACNDTGYAQGNLCACVRNEAARRMFNEAGLTKNSPSFDKFDCSIFSGSLRISDGHTARERMEALRDYGISYADKFPELATPNLLFTGKPGRGKSYLLDCIAARVISRGYWVVRATAYAVNDVMAKALFDRADPDSLFDCDLLALDDLGSEPILNKVTISSFFSLLNERVSKGKPFIVSTNLTVDEILKRYGDRVFSRIADARTTRVIEFEGEDLRR